jgi:hypothetical protein
VELDVDIRYEFENQEKLTGQAEKNNARQPLIFH